MISDKDKKENIKRERVFAEAMAKSERDDQVEHERYLNNPGEILKNPMGYILRLYHRLKPPFQAIALEADNMSIYYDSKPDMVPQAIGRIHRFTRHGQEQADRVIAELRKLLVEHIEKED